jgi:hypothetical protein
MSALLAGTTTEDEMPTTPTTLTLYPLLPATPEHDSYEPLPAAPDGSGDLWWDDASYARYQSHDPYADWTPAMPEALKYEAFSPNYCTGPWTVDNYLRTDVPRCACHNGPSGDDLPF